jgi:hypothetical protein
MTQREDLKLQGRPIAERRAHRTSNETMTDRIDGPRFESHEGRGAFAMLRWRTAVPGHVLRDHGLTHGDTEIGALLLPL